MRNIKLIIVLTIVFGLAYNNSKCSEATMQNDSIKIINLIKEVYKWHELNKSSLPDFDLIVEDSCTIGLDYEFFEKTYQEIINTNFFSKKFLNNYKEIADSLDWILKTANPKYFDELNFPYQEADSWNGFQDDAGEYWNNLSISDFKLTTEKVSLYWWLQGDYGPLSYKYYIEFEKEDGSWKISYMSGFNKNYFK